MEMFTQEIMLLVNQTVKVFTNGKMEVFIKKNSKRESNMEKKNVKIANSLKSNRFDCLNSFDKKMD
jgi:hypothetical protein